MTRPHDPPNGVLVRAAREGDAAAWDALVARFAGRVRIVARSYRLSDADAEDVSQVTWLRLVANLDKIRDPDRVGAWLDTTASHEALRIIRRAGRHGTGDEGWEDAIVSTDPEADTGMLVAERDRALWKAMGMLSPPCQRLLRLLSADPPLSYEEVSAVLEMSVGSIGPTRRRCLDQLRLQLARITGASEGSAG
ncbi:MAG TPA: sigma-70 family RNA polymerase sigma factor [Acidimicrobiales bacterium]|nr:sigma-70 family RNA polymerase sigma factor [Acidimicrobiales bacterium]